ncbi:transcriptional regulator [Lactobacillus nasalidis]|uniref:Transcriptional regulator n=1 Tax=Lactobacillus nasalidis TaxID=2797258 RepID=A0ABQ3W4T9_9LACO|nr:LysR family transcriptional regulator [Lactobacillus nasalidis]GHV98098.1 transcriptional regulator [Lactobacillus nasalidis]GHV99656.1 transcriptional regulator [Lactobacillus nasalidis]GHW00709.1 transcriptional regulator [Lactobacillus nasalidis]
MNFKQLNYFAVVAEEGQITAAARRLFVGQPALSSQLKQLEEELGAKLFVRQPHGIELTDAGKKLYSYSQQILTLARNAETEIKEIEAGRFGSIRLGSVSSSIGCLPSPKLVAFVKDHPGIALDILEDNTFGILEKLKNNLLDLAIIRTPFSRVNLASVEISDEPMTAVTSLDYFAGKESVSLEDLAGCPLVIYRRFEEMFKESFAEKGLTPNFIVKCDDSRTAIRWSDSGLGIALVPESIALAYAKGRIYPVSLDKWRTHLQLVWREDQVVTPLMRQMIALYEKSVF